jgi:hypothetical protein
MATKYVRLRAVAALLACGSLLPVACNGDDDSNPAPSTGGTGAKGGTGGSGGTGAKGGKGGSSGDAGDNGTGGSTGGSAAQGGTGGTGAKGGSAGSGAKGGKGGSGNTGNSGGENNAGSGGEPTVNPGPGCLEANFNPNAHPAACYEDCTPESTDDSEQFLNRCADGSQTLGGVQADCTPWTGTLNALGDGCKKLGPGCVLPGLP